MTVYCPICYQAVTNDLRDGSAWCPDHGRVMVEYHRPVPNVDVRDRQGERILVGMTVLDGRGREAGIVTAVLDADDEQGPRVAVEYHDGDDERWGVRGPRSWAEVDGPYTCDDVEVRP